MKQGRIDRALDRARSARKAGASHQCFYLCGSIGLSFGLVFMLYYYSHVMLLQLQDVSSPTGTGLANFVTNIVAHELKEDLRAIGAIRMEDVSQQMMAWEESIINSTYERLGLGLVNSPAAASTGKSRSISSSSAQRISHDLDCPHSDLVKFWRPPTEADLAYKTPFYTEGVIKYVTFEPDVGGWNNIRMQMEAVLVFAAATGRTLVLPPDQPMYLLNKGKGHHNEHSFADFFPFDYISHVVPVVSMDEFMRRKAVTGHLHSSIDGSVMYPPGNKSAFSGTDARDRNAMWEYLRVAATCPPWKCMREYLVIPLRPGFNSSLSPDAADYERKRLVFAGDKKFGMERQGRYYDQHWHNTKVIHFISKPGGGYRLLQHYYTFIHFEDEAMDRFYKRFVRDYVHYIPVIFCKAALIIRSLLDEGSGVYSSWHVRRGEFQYRETRLPAEDLLKNVGHFIPQNELLFIATDERNKSFFDPFLGRFPRVRFLDDYTELAGLEGLNPNYLGMIDQVVCTRGRLFMGTWFSTFTGYITRMRGYLGHDDNSTRYTDMKHRDRFQTKELPRFPFYMREFPLAWEGIDA